MAAQRGGAVSYKRCTEAGSYLRLIDFRVEGWGVGGTGAEGAAVFPGRVEEPVEPRPHPA